MELAIQLLAVAQLLINLVTSNPSLPIEDAHLALDKAYSSINMAKEEINKIPVPQVNYGSLQANIVEDTPISIPEIKITKRKVEDNFIIKVEVIENGVNLKNVPIKMESPNNFFENEWDLNRKTNAHTYLQEDWYTEFTYRPKESGIYTIKFNYADVTQSIDIKVE